MLYIGNNLNFDWKCVNKVVLDLNKWIEKLVSQIISGVPDGPDTVMAFQKYGSRLIEPVYTPHWI